MPTGSGAGEFDVSLPEEPQPGVDQPQKRRYVFEPMSSFANAKPPSYHIKGVLPEAELIVVFGDSGSGKTFLAMDMGLAVARGEPWRGLRVKQGRVAYVAAEDAPGVRLRATTYADHRGIPRDQLPFYVLGASPDFRDQDDMTEVARGVVALGDVSLIIVDTWARVLAGGDENSAQDVGAAIVMCGKLHRATGATVVLIHHSGKDSSKGARGSSSLRAAADAELEVSRFEDDREVQITKLKNGADGVRYGFKLHIVPVGVDEDGDVVSSCVIEHTETTSKKERNAKKAKGGNQELALKVLDDNAAGGAISLHDLKGLMRDRMIHDDEDGKRDQRLTHAQTAIQGLIERDILEQKDGLIQRKGAA